MINWISRRLAGWFPLSGQPFGNPGRRISVISTPRSCGSRSGVGGTPWEKPEFTGHNPVDLVKNWKTPMLVIHGSKDFRVVVTQGIGTFNALQRRGATQPVPAFSRRKPLDLETGQQHPVARNGSGLARPLDPPNP